MTSPVAAFLQPGTDLDVAEAYASLAGRARDAVFGFEDEIAFVDLETSGFDPGRDEIIEVAVVVARGPEVLGRYESLVRSTRPIPRDTTQLTGIDDEMVASAPSLEVVLGELAEAIGKRDIVAHNASFDRAFLAAAGLGGGRLRGKWIDSLQVTRIALPRLRSHRLLDIARAFGLDGGAHRAAGDAEAVFGAWRIALTALSDMPPGVLAELVRLGDAAPSWPLLPLFAHLAAGSLASGFDLREARSARLRRERHAPLVDAAEVELACPEVAEVIAEFEADGLVGRMYDAYERRDEQARMAEAVISAFGESRCIAVEAGTGVGKSVAYLVPAAKFALLNGVAVGVATKTNNLMDQLVHKELPALAECLGGSFRYVALKGYEHYPCLRKLQRMFGEPSADEETVAALGMLLTWSAQTTWGDLDGVNLHWPQSLRAQVAASVADCTKKRCRYFPHQCYLHGIRRRASAAHVVVTNHSLLFCDLTTDGGILPPIRHWVVDEAHAAEDEAREQLSLGASHFGLRGLILGLHAAKRGGWLDGLRAKLGGLGDPARSWIATVDELAGVLAETATITDSLFDFVKDLGSKSPSAYDRAEIRITPHLRESGAWGTVSGVGISLAKRLERVMQLGRTLVSALEEAGEDFHEQRVDLVGQLSGLAEQHAGLVTVLDGSDDSFVYSVTVDRRREATAEAMRASRLDVGTALEEMLYPKVLSVVYTSATIAAGEDFSHFAHAVGLDLLGDEGYRTLRLASSYDFERQMAVFVPTDLPEPCQPSSAGYGAYLDALERLLLDIHVGLGGSVLTLFTNRRDMDALYRRMVEPLEREGLRLLVQGIGVSRKRVADEFVADESVSLFATKSFWEGFDAKGDTLRCVVVPRLPFGPINDPILEERRDRDREWWEHYYLPEAVLELKQAAGRLIRSSTDTGCLVLADTRLVGPKPYARRFISALPVADVERLPGEQIGAEIARWFGAGG
jgi:ATP-dependent DNA helicase DinG